MPKNGRPPMKAARDYATRRVVEDNQAAFDDYVDEYLRGEGFVQTTETVTRWVVTEPAGSEGK